MSLRTDSEKIVLIAESRRNFTVTKLPPTGSCKHREEYIELSRFTRYLAFPYKIEETENGLKIYHCRQFRMSRKDSIPYCIPNMENVRPRCLKLGDDGRPVEPKSSLKTYDERNLSREGTLDRVIKMFRYCRLADDDKPKVFMKYK